MASELTFLTLGTPYRGGRMGRRTILGAPWEVYAVTIGSAPQYFRVLLEPDRIVREAVNPGTDTYQKIKKWVETRRILSDPNARCRVTEEEAMDLVQAINDAPQA